MKYNIELKHELQEGEIVCPTCNGNNLLHDKDKVPYICNTCFMDGYLTWTEVIVGKKNKMYEDIWLPSPGYSRKIEKEKIFIDSIKRMATYIGY